MRKFFWGMLYLSGAGCLALTAIAVGCGAEDPIDEQCAAVCSQKKEDPCFDKVKECNEDCKAVAGNAAKLGYKGNACGVCIAKLVRYTGKKCKSPKEVCVFDGDKMSSCTTLDPCDATSEQCFGFLKPQWTDPACVTECIEPDAGVTF